MKKTLLFTLIFSFVIVFCSVFSVGCFKSGGEETPQESAIVSSSESGPEVDPQHTHTLTAAFDAEGHWQQCACGYKTEKTAHTLEVEFDAEGHMQECECGYMTAKVAHSLEIEYDEEGHLQKCACGYSTEKAEHTFETVYGGNEKWDECVCGYATEKIAVEGFVGVIEPYGYSAEDFTLADFTQSGKALTFEYKPFDNDANTGVYVTFSLMSGWNRLTDYISLNVVNDVVKSGIGKIEDIGNGWRRITVNCYELPLIEGTVGDETADRIYFQWVDHAFLLANVAFTGEYRKSTQIDSAWGYAADSFSVRDFATSKKALTFEYKAVESELNSGTEVTFSLMSGWNRLTDYITLNLANNTINGGLGKFESLEEGWMKVTINFSEMTINTEGGADGTETANFLYFHWVDHVFLIDKIAFTGEYRKSIEINTPNGYSAAGFSLADFAQSGKALTFEYKPVGDRIEGDNDYVTFSLMSGWTRLTGYISLEVVADNVLSGIGQIENLEDGWRRITVNCYELPLNEGTVGDETADFLYFHWVNHGFLIANVGFTDEYRKATLVDSSWGYSDEGFSVKNFAASGKALTFEYKAVESDVNTGTQVTFSLMCGWNRLIAYVSIDIETDTIGGNIGKIEEAGDGWMKVTINFSEMTINTEGGADGTETVNFLYFHWVDHAFLIDSISIENAAA